MFAALAVVPMFSIVFEVGGPLLRLLLALGFRLLCSSRLLPVSGSLGLLISAPLLRNLVKRG